MKSFFNIALAFSATFLLHSCLFDNDLSYPKLPAEVIEFEVEGQKSVTINGKDKTVAIELDETADISNVTLTKFSYSPEARCENLAEGAVLDLSKPAYFTIKTYYDYEWKITATQPIERYVKCDGQVGTAEFDVNGKLVHVRVTDNQNLNRITFNSIKLEEEGAVLAGYEDEDDPSTIVPVTFPLTIDCNKWRYFHVTSRGKDVRWGINVVQVEVSMAISSQNIFATRAEISGIFNGTGSPYFQYRKSGDEPWTDFTDVTIDQTNVSGVISGLESATGYDIRMVNGEDVIEGESFVTEEAVQLHNMSFDSWWYETVLKNKVWYPNADKNTQIWDTANPGSGGFGFIPTTPTEDVAVSGTGKQAAKCESLNALVAFAAGNVYTGKFGAVSGLGASLDWGVPFESRPSALKGYYKYLSKVIDKAKDPYKDKLGTQDVCQIQILLTDWEKPFTVNTNTGTFVDFINDPNIIAYGKLESDQTVNTYQEFNIELEYRDSTRKPKYIVIVCSSSKYGDYFTGGVGSTLWLDEFELVY